MSVKIGNHLTEYAKFISCFSLLTILVGSSRVTSLRRLQHERAIWEDTTLPFPISVHEIQQPRISKINGRRVKAELTPLYPGYGTHFSYVFVGSPPQRQSVIVDTGSHYTAFPCTGCQECGQHTDNYWDIKNSTSAIIPQCNNAPCQVSQSYSEGSSWKGYKVVDKFWVGGITQDVVPEGAAYSVEFTFACQTFETGLFRTQLADGIMGMSMADDTVPSILKKAGLTDTKMFALCYRIGGGIMTLGGVDQRVHAPSEVIQYARLSNNNGWFGVTLLDISLQDRKSGELNSIPGAKEAAAGGKGAIVDSGTTDTYFPNSISHVFGDIFKRLTSLTYSVDNVAISKEQLNSLPNIVFTFQGVDDKDIFKVSMPWSNYVDSVGDGKYAFRVYVNEPSGFILGANFMTGNNIIFDEDAKRIGFVKSPCKYEDFILDKTTAPTPSPYGDDYTEPACQLIPESSCSASCEGVPAGTGKVKEGVQVWKDSCGGKLEGQGPKACHVNCFGPKLSRGDLSCPDTPWGECSKSCLQTRRIKRPSRNRRLSNYATNSTGQISHHNMRTMDTCDYTSSPRTCYTGSCPVAIGDYLVFVDMKVRINPLDWSYVHSEAFYGAFTSLFKVKEGSVDLLNDANTEYTNRVKLRFEMRLKAKSYSSTKELSDFADGIPGYIGRTQFLRDLIRELQKYSDKFDSLDHKRYAWMKTADIEVSNVIVLPKAPAARDPYENIPNNMNADGSVISLASTTYFDLIFVGVAIGIVSILGIVMYLYIRLRQEHAALEKDKLQGGSLRRMWERFTQMHSKAKGGKEYNYKELRMEDFSAAIEKGELSAEDDTLLDADDDKGNRG